MKSILHASALIVASLAAASAIAAPSGANACQTLTARLSQKSAEFVQVNADGKARAPASTVHLVNFYQGVSKKDAALRDIANEVWTLRTEMASRSCSQADSFSY